jgi:hypothetical protein
MYFLGPLCWLSATMSQYVYLYNISSHSLNLCYMIVYFLHAVDDVSR